MGKYIGIDLGTTFSCMAFIDQNGLPVVIPNAEGKNITPSVVLFTEDETIVGEQAKKKSISKPLQCEQFVKRHMAERDYFFSPGNNESYTPEEISAIILRKMKADAEEFLGESVDGAVITVPAYFNDAQRIATQDAGRIAGLNVIAVINEPTAASISFGLSKNMKSETESKTMVFDLGGGTFDVTVIRIDGENIQVMATAGDRKFGGYDFDKLIIDDAIQKAQQEGIDIEADLNARQDLQLQAEEAKKTLSSSKKASIDLYVKGRSFEYKITRDYFNDIANGLLMRCLASIETVVEEAGIEYSDLDKVLLVGGSTRMPMIRDLIFEETGINPSSEVHPDEAVAIGAAYHAVDVAKKMTSKANNNSRHDSAVDNREKTELTVDAQSLPEIPRNYKFTDVTSHGIGIVCTTNSGEINSVILPANTPVPASNTQYYQTMEPYQESLLIKITQGEEEDLRYVSIIGDSTVNIEPREKLANIEVTISCDENSIIHVRVYDCDYKRSLGEIKIDRVSNLTEEQIRTNQNKIHKLNIGEDD